MRKPLLLLGLRALGALALLAIAAVHLYEYYADQYSAIPTIGTLFLLNGAGAIALALILLAPVNALLPRPAARWILPLSASGGIALAATALAALFVSETQPLFGFMEVGYRPVIVAAIASEAAAILVLAPAVLLSWRAGRPSIPAAGADLRRPEPPAPDVPLRPDPSLGHLGAGAYSGAPGSRLPCPEASAELHCEQPHGHRGQRQHHDARLL